MSSFLDKYTTEVYSAVHEGIITADQAKQMIQLCSDKKPASKMRGVFAFGLIAGLMVAAGICLIISHNWDRIPDLLKISTFILLLTGTALFSIKAKSPAVGIPLDILWFFLPLLGIGLYAQIFQLSGDPIKPYLVWMALTLPLAWLSERSIVRVLHVVTLFMVLFWGNFASGTMMTIEKMRWASHPIELSPTAWVYTLSILAIIILETLKLTPKLFVLSIGGIIGWVLAILINETIFHLAYEPAIIFALVSSAVLWVGLTARLDIPDQARKIPRLAWFVAVYSMTFLWHAHLNFSREINMKGLWLSFAIAAGAISFSILIRPNAFGKNKLWRIFGQAMMITPILVSALVFNNTETSAKVAGLLANIIFVFSAVGLMIHGVRAGVSSQIDTGLLAFVILVFTRFIDIFGSLLRSGFAFIFIGLIMAIVAWGLYRSRRTLLRLSEENKPS